MPAKHGDHHDRPHPGFSRTVHPDPQAPVDPDLAPDDLGEPSRSHHPVPHTHRARQHSVLAAIAVGGFGGALGRYEAERTWPPVPGHVPWSTLVINLSGSFLLGLILILLLEYARDSRHLRPLICVGAIGAWTTMSTFVVEVDQLVRHGDLAVAVAYVVMTTVLGLGLVWTGMILGRRFGRRRTSWRS